MQLVWPLYGVLCWWCLYVNAPAWDMVTDCGQHVTVLPSCRVWADRINTGYNPANKRVSTSPGTRHKASHPRECVANENRSSPAKER